MAQTESGANLPAQVIGANDLLLMSVYGMPELTRTVRVDPDGTVRLPMVQERIPAAGVMPAELESRIAQALVASNVLVDPVVSIAISEFHSRPIQVIGAVKNPVTFQSMGRTTLLDALTRAQGLTEDAGEEILVTRQVGTEGQRESDLQPQRIPVRKLIERTDPHLPKSGLRIPFRGAPKSRRVSFLPRGFAQMSVIDLRDFNRQTYRMEYVRREFLGEVRCFVFDVAPLRPQQAGKFVGRIWVEDRDNFIVRFNGTYVQPPPSHSAAAERYFHFDSWRVNTGGSTWIPALIYVEEEGGSPASAAEKPPRQEKRTSPKDRATAMEAGGAGPEQARFKAQSRIWDYAAAPSNRLEELTNILVESKAAVSDEATTKDISPLESQRSWERQAEENLLARLEKGGMLAPTGPVSQVLDTVVNNLIISANLNVEARCRVLLTTPMETFSIGHTIVISRGMIDVLPDEASLALVLATELSHIALGHRTQTQFAFYNRTMLSDAELLQRFHFQRPVEEMSQAATKTIEMMRASPYAKAANAGLFLKALAGRREALPRLLQANLGNQIADAASLLRLQAFADAAPALEEDKLEQIAALPLGSRIKVNPWTNQIELVKARPLALLSPREKMPFEVTPVVLYLTRPDATSKPSPVAASKR